jgi:hypothetical protein
MDIAREIGLDVIDRHINCRCFMTGHFDIGNCGQRVGTIQMVEAEIYAKYRWSPDPIPSTIHQGATRLYDTHVLINLADPNSIEELRTLFADIKRTTHKEKT